MYWNSALNLILRGCIFICFEYYFGRVPWTIILVRVNMNNNSSASTLLQNQAKQRHMYSFGLKAMSKLLPIAIAITLTNGLVFVMFYKRKRLRTASNYLLLGLAVCDFFTGTINIPYYIIFSFGVIPLNSIFSHSLYTVHTLMAISAGYHILIITAEKYFAVIRPLRHRFITKTTVCKLCLGIWIISAGFALVTFTWRTSPLSSICYVTYSAFCLLMVFLAPYIFMVYAYRVMFRAISKRKMPGLTNDYAILRFHKKKVSDRKCVLVFAAMATVYVTCWLPYFTVMLIINIRQYLLFDYLLSLDKAIEVFVIIRYMTSVINPLLYTFFKRDFWFVLKSLSKSRQLTIPTIHSTRRMRSCSLHHNDFNPRQSIFCDERVTLVAYGKVNQACTVLRDKTTKTTSV